MELQQWLDNIEQFHPNAIELGLDRVAEVAQRLKLGFNCPIITVAGTNGKGSTIAFLESILSEQGYRIGTYTSPHLLTFNERIRINGKEISDELLCKAFTKVNQQRHRTSLTYFEFTTLAALYLFQMLTVDVILLEVGMGGRLDAVNIIDPTIAIITSIDLDHMAWLGEDREAIGFEKAGIFRHDQLAVCGDPNPPESLLKQAEQKRVQLSCVNSDFFYEVTNKNWHWQYHDQVIPDLPLTHLPLSSAASALMAIYHLQKSCRVDPFAIYSGIQKTFLAGRFQIINNRDQTYIVDVAHNPAATQYLSRQLSAYFGEEKFQAVVGMLADKDLSGTLSPLRHQVAHWHLCHLHVPRGAHPDLLQQHLPNIGIEECSIYDSIQSALTKLSKASKSKILIFGSFYTVAAALQLLQNKHG